MSHFKIEIIPHVKETSIYFNSMCYLIQYRTLRLRCCYYQDFKPEFSFAIILHHVLLCYSRTDSCVCRITQHLHCVLTLTVVSPVVQVWCLSSSVQPEEQMNRTIDGAVLSILLTGLLPDARYTVTVAAVTSLGVGAQSPPVSLLLSELLLQILYVEMCRTMNIQVDYVV